MSQAGRLVRLMALAFVVGCPTPAVEEPDDSAAASSSVGSASVSGNVNSSSSQAASSSSAAVSSSTGSASNNNGSSSSGNNGSSSSGQASSSSGGGSGGSSSSNGNGSSGSSSGGSSGEASSSSSSGGGGDICTTPLVLALGENLGDTTGKGNFTDGDCQLAGGFGGGDDVVYSFVSPTDTVDLHLTLRSARDMGMWVRLGCTATPEANELCVDAAFAEEQEYAEFTLPPGLQIFVFVGGYTPSDNGPFSLFVSTRKVVAAGDDCDPASDRERCDDGLTCAEVGGNFICDNPANELTTACDNVASITPGTPYVGTTLGARGITDSQCSISADGGEMVLSYHVQNAPADVLAVLTSASDQGVSVRRICNDPVTERGCSESGPGGTEEAVLLFDQGDVDLFFLVGAVVRGTEGPFTLTVTERPILAESDLCDLAEEDNRCGAGLSCETVAGNDVCVQHAIPEITAASAVTLDINLDGVFERLTVTTSGLDAEADVLGLELTFKDSQGFPLDLIADAGETNLGSVFLFNFDAAYGLASFADLSVPITGFDIVENQADIASLDVALVDEFLLRSDPPINVVPTPFPVRAVSETCDPAELADVCRAGLNCENSVCTDLQAEVCANPTELTLGVTFSGDTTTASDLTLPSCGGLGGTDLYFTYTVTANNVDVLATLTSATDQGVSIRSACSDVTTEVDCADIFLGGENEVAGVTGAPPRTVLTVVVSSYTAAAVGPFTVTMTERPILTEGQPCDSAGVLDRCDDLTLCKDDGLGAFTCTPYTAPNLLEASAHTLDRDADGVRETMFLLLSGEDVDEDVVGYEITLRDTNGFLVGAYVHTGDPAPGFAGAVLQVGLDVYGEPAFADVRSDLNWGAIINEADVHSVDVVLLDESNHRSNVRAAVLTEVPIVDALEACDPDGVTNACPADLDCRRNLTGATVCMDDAMALAVACDLAESAAADSTINGDTSTGQDYTASCEQAGGLDVFYSYTVTGPNTDTFDVIATVASGIDHVVSLRTVCADPASEVMCADDPVNATATEIAQALNVRGAEVITIIVGTYSPDSSGPFTLTVRQRPVLGATDSCDSTGVANRCGIGTVCENDGVGGPYSCVQKQPPVLTAASVFSMDANGDLTFESLSLVVSGTDVEGDVATLEMVFKDSAQQPLPLIFDNGVDPPETLPPTLSFPLAQVEGQTSFADIIFTVTGFQGVSNQADIKGLDITVIDATELRSNTIEDVALDPQHNTVLDLACTFADPIAAGVVTAGDTGPAADNALSGCEDTFFGGGTDVFYTFTTGARISDVTAVVSSATDQGISIRTNCADDASELICKDLALGGIDESVELLDQPAFTTFTVMVTAYSGFDTGPYTVTVFERRHVDTGDTCDPAGVTTLCPAGTVCQNAGAGPVCITPQELLNASCAGSTNLTGTVDGTTADAADVLTPSCGLAGGLESYFDYSVTGALVDVIVTLESATNHGISVFSACQDSTSEVVCADARGGGQDEVLTMLDMTVGAIWLVVSSRTADDAGAFSVTVMERTVANPGEMCDPAGVTSRCATGNVCFDSGMGPQCQPPVSEAEPNEDGSISGGGGNDGGDFSSAGANGPYSADVIISASIGQVGDEDVFAISNTLLVDVVVRLETFGSGGPGTCRAILEDTVLHLRDDLGVSLATNDDGVVAPCSNLEYTIPAETTVYAHVLDKNQDGIITRYYLSVDFVDN